jgi:hypothetical protein
MGDKDLMKKVNKIQLPLDGIDSFIDVHLEDQEPKIDIPEDDSVALREAAQKTVNTLKFFRDNAVLKDGYTGAGEMTDFAGLADALPPFLTDRDGYLIVSRGGILIELNPDDNPDTD